MEVLKVYLETPREKTLINIWTTIGRRRSAEGARRSKGGMLEGQGGAPEELRSKEERRTHFYKNTIQTLFHILYIIKGMAIHSLDIYPSSVSLSTASSHP